MRFTLKSDFTDKWRRTYRAGQQGCIFGHYHPEYPSNCVEFDGYENEKREDDEFAVAHGGEGANIVPWMADVPTELLDVKTEETTK